MTITETIPAHPLTPEQVDSLRAGKRALVALYAQMEVIREGVRPALEAWEAATSLSRLSREEAEAMAPHHETWRIESGIREFFEAGWPIEDLAKIFSGDTELGLPEGERVGTEEASEAPVDLELFGVTIPGELLERAAALQLKLGPIADSIEPTTMEAHDVLFELSKLTDQAQERGLSLIDGDAARREADDALTTFIGRATHTFDLWGSLMSISMYADPDEANAQRKDTEKLLAEVEAMRE